MAQKLDEEPGAGAVAARGAPRVMVAVGGGAMLLLAFLLLVAVVHGGDVHAVDRWLMAAPHRMGGGRALEHGAVNLTALGSGTVLVLFVLLVIGFLLIQRLWLTALLVGLATASGGAAVSLVKHMVGRARPDLVPHLVEVHSASFPSGHAANSAMVYLTLAALGSQLVEGRRRRLYLFGAALLLTFLIGTSRVLLGVHWPSDVVGGWCFGALWALLWWWLGLAARRFIGAGPHASRP